MHHTGKKESNKEIKKKKEKNKVTKNLLRGDSIPNQQNKLELKVDASIHWTTCYF